MAEVDEVPQDLRQLARRVDPITRSNMSAAELTLRCSYAAHLIGDADLAGDDHKADRLRRKAGKVLAAMSADALSAESARLNQVMTEARRRGDDRAAWEAFSDLERLARNHPQPPAEYVMSAVMATAGRAVESKLKIPAPDSGHFWARRKAGRKR